MKKACVLRWGAWGDLIMCSPLFKLLKKDGYHVTAHITKRAKDVLKGNPYIDEFIVYVDDTVPFDKLGAYWDDLSKQYDRFINLSGSIEEGLLAAPWQDIYTWKKEERHKKLNVNYYDRTLELGGYPIKGRNGELYLTKDDEKIVRSRLKPYRDKFVILWSLSGSSYHKTYPFAEQVALRFLENHKDAQIICVGETLCYLLEWDHRRSFNASGAWSMRTTMALTKYVDLVIGPETGVMNAAGCFDTPKIVFLSHSSEENLTKYWKNCTALHGEAFCYPCHMLHYNRDSCPHDSITTAPLCMARIKPEDVYNAMEQVYQRKMRKAA